jgi:hypothetical protein
MWFNKADFAKPMFLHTVFLLSVVINLPLNFILHGLVFTVVEFLLQKVSSMIEIRLSLICILMLFI